MFYLSCLLLTHMLLLRIITPLCPAYLSQGCGPGSWLPLLCCSGREPCQIWTSCSFPGPSLCPSRPETASRGLGSHTQQANRRESGEWSAMMCRQTGDPTTKMTTSSSLLSYLQFVPHNSKTISSKRCHFIIMRMLLFCIASITKVCLFLRAKGYSGSELSKLMQFWKVCNPHLKLFLLINDLLVQNAACYSS